MAAARSRSRRGCPMPARTPRSSGRPSTSTACATGAAGPPGTQPIEEPVTPLLRISSVTRKTSVFSHGKPRRDHPRGHGADSAALYGCREGWRSPGHPRTGPLQLRRGLWRKAGQEGVRERRAPLRCRAWREAPYFTDAERGRSCVPPQPLDGPLASWRGTECVQAPLGHPAGVLPVFCLAGRL
jgi:hypothetical protein